MSLVIQSWAQLLVLVAAIVGVLAWQTHYIDKRIDDLRSGLNTRINDLRSELKGEIAQLRTELKGEIAQLRTELKGEIAQLRTELKDLKIEIQELSKALVHQGR